MDGAIEIQRRTVQESLTYDHNGALLVMIISRTSCKTGRSPDIITLLLQWWLSQGGSGKMATVVVKQTDGSPRGGFAKHQK